MTGMMQIWPLTEVRARVEDDPSVDEIRIYPGHIDKPKGMVTMNLKKLDSGEWNNKQFDRLELHKGHYTAILSPSKEVIWMEGQNHFQDPDQYSLMYQPYSMNGQQPVPQYGNMDMMQLFKELGEYKEKCRILQVENEELKEELQQFETASGKFEHAIGNMIMNFVLPMFSGEPQPKNQRIQQTKNTSAMQGNNQQEEQEVDFTQFPIRDQGDGGVQDAFTILYHAFGDELIVKIAQRLQREPGLVNTLRAFIG